MDQINYEILDWMGVPGLINKDQDGEDVFEWWKDNRKLTLYIKSGFPEPCINYIKVWGSDMDNEMEDGIISTGLGLGELRDWLIGYRIE